ncbi:diguanylate cyclase [Bacillus sp. CGMCC 1.16607]|uniref:sensor domain-containing diguanylate cyclase n=1 Tax=Bacillus sp. CGMCC 1.16607 TaxID=3351842 RepID=UPI00362E7682
MGNKEILSLINHLLKNIGVQKNILSKETLEEFEKHIGDREEKEIVDSVLLQLELINDQMENMSWLNKHYKILHDFAQICSKTLDEDILLEKAYEMVSQVMNTESFFIAFYNEAESLIDFTFVMDKGEYYPPIIRELGDNYTTQAILSREIVHQKQLAQSEEYNALYGSDGITRSCLFVPVIIDDHVRGVISAQSYSDFAYRKEHEELLQIIGTQVINSIETARLYRRIFVMSQTDELTGLKNHRAFHDDLSKMINDNNQEITLIMIDSDHLKKVNDNFGHDIGDRYLKILADGIKSVCGENIEGYRYAGDEFMIIMKSPLENEMENLYDNLMEYYKQNPLIILEHSIIVSVSSGVAVFPNHGKTVDSLKKAVDDALYVAKKQGRNRFIRAEKTKNFLYLFNDEMFFI